MSTEKFRTDITPERSHTFTSSKPLKRIRLVFSQSGHHIFQKMIPRTLLRIE